jgi:hypothetical protein
MLFHVAFCNPLSRPAIIGEGEHCNVEASLVAFFDRVSLVDAKFFAHLRISRKNHHVDARVNSVPY